MVLGGIGGISLVFVFKIPYLKGKTILNSIVFHGHVYDEYNVISWFWEDILRL